MRRTRGFTVKETSTSPDYATATNHTAGRTLLEGDPIYGNPSVTFAGTNAEPGTVLRSRDVELAFLGLIPQQVMATQLLYRTTDMNGQPEATATTRRMPGSLF